MPDKGLVVIGLGRHGDNTLLHERTLPPLCSVSQLFEIPGSNCKQKQKNQPPKRTGYLVSLGSRSTETGKVGRQVEHKDKLRTHSRGWDRRNMQRRGIFQPTCERRDNISPTRSGKEGATMNVGPRGTYTSCGVSTLREHLNQSVDLKLHVKIPVFVLIF